MRHSALKLFQPICGIFSDEVFGRDGRDFPADPAQPRRHAMFEAPIGQQLHAHADAEKGFRAFFARIRSTASSMPSMASRPRRQSAKAPTPGSTTRSAVATASGIAGDGLGCASPHARGALESFERGMKIARAIVDDGDAHDLSSWVGDRPAAFGARPGGPSHRLGSRAGRNILFRRPRRFARGSGPAAACPRRDRRASRAVGFEAKGQRAHPVNQRRHGASRWKQRRKHAGHKPSRAPRTQHEPEPVTRSPRPASAGRPAVETLADENSAFDGVLAAARQAGKPNTGTMALRSLRALPWSRGFYRPAADQWQSRGRSPLRRP